MRGWSQGRFWKQVRFVRRQFLQDGGLPLTDVLTGKMVEQALTAAGVMPRHSGWTSFSALARQAKCSALV